MFPNIRLMIAAVVASIVALGCGFSLFAEFRVSHEPLGRMPATSPPLQFAASSPGLAGWAAAAVPVSARPTVIQTALTEAAGDPLPDAGDADDAEAAISITAPAPIVAHDASAEPAAVAAPPEPQSNPAPSVADVSPQAVPDAPVSSDPAPAETVTSASAPATQPEPPPPAADNAAPVEDNATSAVPPSGPANAVNESEPSSVATKPDSDTGVAETPPPAAASTAVAAVQPAAQLQQGQDDAPTSPPIEQTQQRKSEATPSAADAVTEAPAQERVKTPAVSVAPKSRAKATAKAPRRVARRAEPKHHTAMRRVAHRPEPPATAASYQGFGYAQQNFQPQQAYAFPEQAPQPAAETTAARRHVVLKIEAQRPSGSRATRQSAVGGPFVSPPPQ
jgi:hypothetical protein